MPMSSDAVTQHMAQDFSAFLTETIGLDDAPADEFFDPIATVFGSALTQNSVVRVLKSPDASTRLAAELNSWLQSDAVTIDLAQQLLELTVANNFGLDAAG